MAQIERASGCTVTAAELLKERAVWIESFGADPEKSPVENTDAINRAIGELSQTGGGTVEIPEGDFHIYTLRLRSNVNLHLNRGAILRAARTDIRNAYEKQEGEGGNYDEPEVNLYAGLQDHGHTYFANSLLYGADIENVMIYGEGRIDGSYMENGFRRYALLGGDPLDNPSRKERGHTGEWFGNKAIALVRAKNVVLKDFRLLIGGHFAVIAEGVANMLVDGLLVDTTRDALDIDCCQDVTVRNSVFNSLTDDALVLKASYGAGLFLPVKNVLVEDCTVSGYDAGSVYAGKYTRDKLIATDRCGPTARVKLGTESTCGYELVTVRRVKFDRSRGFALEAVDGSDLRNIVFTDCTMDNVSSSPIFIRAGERGRFPVTGNSSGEAVNGGEGNVRLDNTGWVLPDKEAYQRYPARRYTPSYVRDKTVTVDGYSDFQIVGQEEPCRVNAANLAFRDGKYYAVKYEEEEGRYCPDYDRQIPEREIVKYANACGSPHMARVSGIEISNVRITNADPRYPILLMGLMDSRLKDIVLKHIEVEYRGGLSMEHAVEQRQLNTNWSYTQYETESSVQTLPWLVNTFFLKNEGLLPRVDWDEGKQDWRDDPYNVPELPEVYPEPSNWGILPAYGLYARHVEGLVLDDIKISLKVADGRHPMVFDDVEGAVLAGIQTDCSPQVSTLAMVTNAWKRPTHMEYIKDEPYLTTCVSHVTVPEGMRTEQIRVEAPAPGTPKDSLYTFPTVACPETGYTYRMKTEHYPLPLTVHRPFFVPVRKKEGYCGVELSFTVKVRNPALEASEKESEAFIYNEAVKKKDFTVGAARVTPKLTADNLPQGAAFNGDSGRFTWIPKKGQEGSYELAFTYDDGVIPEKMKVEIEIR